MKKVLFLLIIVAFIVAFYNQRQEKPNVIITAIAVIIFMFGLMKMSSDLPSKNDENDNEEI